MSHETRIVVFCGSPVPQDANRIEQALTRFAGTCVRAAEFERVENDSYAASAGHGTTFVGCVNYLVAADLQEALREAAHNMPWARDYTPLVLILRDQDNDGPPETLTMDSTGTWR